MMNLVIDQTGVETQRSVVKEEMKQRYEGRPYGRLFENVFKTTFKGTQYEWMPIGAVEDLNSASLEEFIDFHSQYYLPNNAVLVVGGDIDVDQTRDLIEKYFGDIKKGPGINRVKVVVPEQTEPREMVVEEAVTPLPAYVEAYVTVDYRNDDAFALEFLGDVLSNGKSSRLYRRLVDEEQIAMMSASFAMPLDQSGLFAFYAIANQGSTIDQLQTSIREELERVQKEGITAEEFHKVRNAKETEITRSLTSLDSKLRDMAMFASAFDDPGIVNRRLEKYMKVTQEDIRRVAQKYLKPERKNVVKYVVMDSTN
jgi:predicted Zn-dependent peptidase